MRKQYPAVEVCVGLDLYYMRVVKYKLCDVVYVCLCVRSSDLIPQFPLFIFLIFFVLPYILGCSFQFAINGHYIAYI